MPTELSRAWDTARLSLLGTKVADAPLRAIAFRVNTPWYCPSGDKDIRVFLEMSWDEVNELTFKEKKTPITLLEIVQAAVKVFGVTPSKNEVARNSHVEDTVVCGKTPEVPCPLISSPMCSGVQHQEKELRHDRLSVDEALHRLGIEPSTSTELVVLSTRARTLLRSAELTNVGSVLEYLKTHDEHSLRRYGGIGGQTELELFSFRDAVLNVRGDLVASFLPMRQTGYGLCFSAAASHLIESLAPEDYDVLVSRYVDHMKQRVTASQDKRTRGRIAQITCTFADGMDRVLAHFPTEKHQLWTAWEQCEALELLLGEELDGLGKGIVSGVLCYVFSRSEEGRATVKCRQRTFDSWWGTLQDMPEFYLGGLKVAPFVRGKGHPEFLVPFLDYLAHKSGVEVERTTGKAISKRKPLLQLVRALRLSSSTQMSLDELLERLQQEVEFSSLTRDSLGATLSQCMFTTVNPGSGLSYAPSPTRKQRELFGHNEYNDALEVGSATDESDGLHVFSTKGIVAQGRYSGSGRFVILKGSEASATLVPSFPEYLIEIRNELLEQAVLVLRDGCLVFNKDAVFSSPSAAACVVSGGCRSGRASWKCQP